MGEKKFMEFNLNHYVYVQLTDLGLQRLADLHNEYIGKIKGWEYRDAKFYKDKQDAEGYTKMQAWEFIQDFGDVTGLGHYGYYALDILIRARDLEPYQIGNK